jgi:hypothetical protein
MAGAERERTGVVVIRLWIERQSAGDGLRARITLVRDLGDSDPESAVAADPEEVMAVVRRFVEEFAGAR